MSLLVSLLRLRVLVDAALESAADAMRGAEERARREAVHDVELRRDGTESVSTGERHIVGHRERVV